MSIPPVQLTDTFDIWRTRTNQIINVYTETNDLARASYNATNSAAVTAANIAVEVLSGNTGLYNQIYDTANATTNTIISIVLTDFYNVANVSYDQSNVAVVKANLALDIANAAILSSNSAFIAANLAYNTANNFVANASNSVGEVLASNTIIVNAIATAVIVAYEEWLTNTDITYVGTIANGSFNASNASYLAANTARNAANASFNASNGAFLTANTGYNKANSANYYAFLVDANSKASFALANTANAAAVAAFRQANLSFINVSDDGVDATRYIAFINTASGNASTLNVSSSKLTFNPNTGALAATIFNSTSDLNQKRDIIEISSALEKVKQMRGVEFTWIDNSNKSYGLIAQELEQIAPELISETNGIKSINYSGIIAFLVEAIKELEKKIEK